MMPKENAKVEVTKDEFNAYRVVQYGGRFNMFAPQARLLTGLSEETYSAIMTQYSELEARYGSYE